MGNCKVCILTLARLLSQINVDIALLRSFISAFVKFQKVMDSVYKISGKIIIFIRFREKVTGSFDHLVKSSLIWDIDVLILAS